MAADAGGAKFVKSENSFLPTKKLKESEVSMLVILAIIVVAVLGVYFVLYPMYKNMSSLTEDIEGLKATEFEVKNQIALTESFEQQFKEAESNFNRFSAYFYPPMDPELIDKRVTSMFIAHNMNPFNFNMTSLAVESIPPYMATELRANPTPDTTETTEEAPAGATEDAAANPEENQANESVQDPAQATGGESYAFVYTVNVSAYGDRNNLFTFLSQVATMTAMEVESFNFIDPRSEKDQDGKTTTIPGEVNMTIKMYVLVDGVPARDFSTGQ